MNNISVVVPTLNEEKNISNLVSDLYNQTIVLKDIIVVDGGSRDNTLKILAKFKNVKVVKSKPNPALQRNIGADRVSGEIIIFLDADVRLKSNFLENTQRQFSQKNLGLACPYFIPFPGSVTINIIYSFFNFMFYIFQSLSPAGAGSCIVVKKNIFAKSAGFNPKFKFEDIELIKRLSKTNKFRMLNLSIKVSDRRFRKYGVWRTFSLYLILSFLFLFHQFRLSNKVGYDFGDYV